MDGKTKRAAQYDKSRSLKNVLHSIFNVDIFLQQFLTIQSMLQSYQLVENMVTIGIDISYGVYHYV